MKSYRKLQSLIVNGSLFCKYIYLNLSPCNVIFLPVLDKSFFSLQDCTYFVTVYSSIQQTSVSKVFKLCHGRRGIVYTETRGILMSSTGKLELCINGENRHLIGKNMKMK